MKSIGLVEIRNIEGGAGLGEKIKSAVTDMVSVNHLLDIESNSDFHHQYK